MERKIIGEGSYGCVHKPSIHCETPPKPGFDYKDYVSKLMKTKNAEKELDEFVTINNIDTHEEYHLGSPFLCKPDISDSKIKKEIKGCKYIKEKDVISKPDKYSLLVLKYGGPDLKAFCNDYIEKYLETDKDIRTANFWLEAHHLIKGLKFFKENGIIHNDIKPQNILFDSKSGKLKYIDFGLMRTKKEVIQSSVDNDNFLGLYHWSYPFDCGFMEKKEYNKYKNRNPTRRTFWKNELSELIVSDSNVNTLDLPIHNPRSFSILFTYINPEDNVPDASTQYGYINSFFDGFNELIDTKSYKYVLNHIADSIDVFGLGFTLQFIANCFKRKNALSLDEFTRLSTFLHKMYDFNPLTRVIDIDALLNEYENVLLEIGVLSKLNKSFENNNVVSKSPAPPSIMKEIKKDEHSPPQYLTSVLEKIANKDAVEIIKSSKKTNKSIKSKSKSKSKTRKIKSVMSKSRSKTKSYK